MKLALCMIVKGHKDGEEVHEISRALTSVREYVDQIFITTTKEHIEPGKSKGGKITFSNFDWNNNFADARNYNLEQAKDYEYIMWIDSDDVVIDAKSIPDVIAEMDKNQLDAVFVDYNYEIDRETKEVVIVHPRERIVRNGVYTWKGALHETLIPIRQVNTRFIKDFHIDHHPSNQSREENKDRNLDILATQYNRESKEVQEGIREEIDPRTEYYLARILYDIHTDESHNRALQLFQDYLEHSGWDEERAMAWCYLGNIMYHNKNYADAVTCYISAIKERPEFPTWYLMLARTYTMMNDFDKAEFYVKQGISLKQPNTAVILTPRDDKMNALLTLYSISFQRRKMRDALKYANAMYEMIPDDENEGRVKSIKELIKMGDWLKTITSMVKQFGDNRQTDKIRALLDSIPEEIQNTIYTTRLRNEFLPPEIWKEKSVAIFAASDFEAWSPKSLDSGVGGSEEALIYLAKEWTKKGYLVRVYANVGVDEGTHDGVEYLNYQRFNHRDKFDILVGWRNPMLFRMNIFDARLVLLDLHDVPVEGEFDDEVLNAIDYIMVKSKYHRSLLPSVPDEKFKIIGNGIDIPKLKKSKGKNSRYKIFWGSSYDRGLHNLLKIWPDIIREEPLAELHICYGWNLYKSLYAHVPHMMKWAREMDQLMTLPGIKHHGRLGKKELYDVAKDCGIWAYPTNFQEIHCITACYTQALGCVPVVYDYAALKETVKYGVRLDLDVHDKESLDKYKDELIKILKDGDEQKRIRESIDVDEFNWDVVSNQWIKVFGLYKTQTTKLSIITPTIRTGFWNLMASNLNNQTYQNFEWIIVDDHKKDRSDVAKKYAVKHGLDIKYVRGKKNNPRKYGLSSANNIGWKTASGELLVFLQDFVILPNDGLERLVEIHEKHPNSLIAPVDEYRSMKISPDIDNAEDWFNGTTEVIGRYIRQNIRIGLGELRYSDNPYDFEMNFGAIPKKAVDDLNGWWEFYDDALGYDNTEIALRAIELGYDLIVDERNRATCLDLWEHIRGTEENGKDREWNLNDPRFEFMCDLMKDKKMGVVRDEKLDDRLLLSYEIPKTTSQDGAVEWMKEHLEEIIKRWKHENSNNWS